jgi:hypothetical protein
LQAAALLALLPLLFVVCEPESRAAFPACRPISSEIE